MPVTIKNLEFIRQYPEFGAKLAEALDSIASAHNSVESQVNGNSTGQPQSPPAINALRVNESGGYATVSVVDHNPIYRGVRYFVEHADNPQFTNPTVHPMQDSRNATIPIGNQTRFFRAYSAYSSSAPNEAVYHGSASQPRAVVGSGSSTGPNFSDAQGSGTGLAGAGLSGPGPIPYRTTDGKPPVR